MTEKKSPHPAPCTPHVPPDRLNEKIGVLTRREVEARMLIPLIEALGETFDREQVLGVVRTTIIRLAREQGAAMAEGSSGCGAAHFAQTLPAWTRDDALELDVLTQTERVLDFNVTRCRYAELYRSLGIPELGALFSCNRDAALIEGFNPRATLARTQTIMAGADHCDFRYRFPPTPAKETP